MAVLWLARDGRTLIVHPAGSGSGSLLTRPTCGDDPVDFLRPAAIGCHEICWNEERADQPSDDFDHEIDDAR